jgi:hypothetical protein
MSGSGGFRIDTPGVATIHLLVGRWRYTSHMKATHRSDPMEGFWLGMLLCVPLWTAVLLLTLR